MYKLAVPSLALLLVLCCAMTSVSGLRCYFRTEELHPMSSSTNASASVKQYDCPKEDKYCVNLQGQLNAAVENLTFAFKSCESEVKSYLDPISTKLGQKLKYDCVVSGMGLWGVVGYGEYIHAGSELRREEARGGAADLLVRLLRHRPVQCK